MAVSEEIIASLVEAVAALNQRTNDAMSRTMVAGPQGEAGPKGEKGDDAPPFTDEQIKSAAVAWLQDNITQPKDGIDGKDGKDGERGPEGRPPTDEEIQLAVNIWFEINSASLIGPAGSDGRDGADGRDGSDGRNGRDGAAGAAGPAGVGIALVEQRDEASFWITLTDGQEFQIELPKAKIGGFGGGSVSGGGISSITSADGTVTISQTGSTVDLSVVGGGGGPTTNVVALVRNRTGAAIPKGTVVYISGATGQTSTISLALATSDATSAQTLGLTTETIANNDTGYVVSFGYLSDVNTAAYTDGQQLYLSPTVAGGMTATKPHAPNHLVYVAVVEYAHANHGKLFVKVQNGYELDEIHDVAISGLLNLDILQYDGGAGLWRNTQGVLDGGTFN